MFHNLSPINAGRPTGLKAASYATKLNANAASAKRSQAQSAATFQAALEYRRQQQALADTAAVSAAAAEAASEAAALEAAAVSALAEAAAAAAVARTAAAAAEADEGATLTESGVVAGANLNGSEHGGQDVKSNRPQHAQQGPAMTNGSQDTSLLNGQSRHDVSAKNNNQRSTTAQNGAQSGGRHQNGTAQPLQAYTVTSHDNVRSGSGTSRDDAVCTPSQNGGSNVPQSRDGVNAKSSGSDVVSDSSDHALSASPSQASASSVADDAMTAAIASIKLQQGDAKPKAPAEGKAIPTPSPGTSPRIKSALLAAQEYRKQKAAKTAALAIAAAAAAKSARLQDSS